MTEDLLEHDDLLDHLRDALESTTSGLGRRAGRSYFSPKLSYGRHDGPARPTTKPAAVMILVEPSQSGWRIPLTVRPNHLPDHPGQISFPGGRIEHNETPLEAANREFQEELGTPMRGQIVGCLSPIYVFNSDYLVTPFVALADSEHQYQPCEFEVAEVVSLPIRHLTDPSFHEIRDYERGGIAWSARSIISGPHCIWGATAVLLGELSSLLQSHSKLVDAD
ncbi:MAG: CoA pyrophosphatase [Planctomycetota bacterium]